MMKKETVYPYDESFQKIAKKLPLSGAFLSLARTIQAKMQKEQTLPKGMKKRIFEVSGYQGASGFGTGNLGRPIFPKSQKFPGFWTFTEADLAMKWRSISC